MRRGSILVLVGLAGVMASSSTPAAGGVADRPPWLRNAIERTVARTFAGTQPTRIDVLGYPRKAAVVFTFERPTRNADIRNPFGGAQPRSRVWRTGFYRPLYHSTSWAWHACATRRACLYR